MEVIAEIGDFRNEVEWVGGWTVKGGEGGEKWQGEARQSKKKQCEGRQAAWCKGINGCIGAA